MKDESPRSVVHDEEVPLFSVIRSRLTYANVMASVAVFLALGGGAYAAATIGSSDIQRNAVLSKHIKKANVKGGDIAPNAVNGTKVADGSLNGADVFDGSLAGADVLDGSLTGADVSNNSLAGADVSDNSLGGADVDEGTLGTVPSASSASSASNADKVDGFHANDLGRGTSAFTYTGINDFNACAFTSALSRTITAPTSGILLVNGAVTHSWDSSSAAGTSTYLYAGVGLGTGTTGSWQQGSTANTAGSAVDSVSPVAAIPVSAGSHTVNLQIAECGSAMAFVHARSLNVQFVPFGSVGGIGSLSREEANAKLEPGGPEQE